MPHRLQHLEFLSFPNELFSAPGTGDGNFSFASGDTDGLVALGTVKIPVLPVLEPVKKLQELPVLLIPLVGIAGHGPADGPDHKAIGENQENKIEGESPDKGGDKTCNEAGGQNHHAQPVGAIAPVHEALHSPGHIREEAMKPSAETVHNKITLCSNVRFIILQNP